MATKFYLHSDYATLWPSLKGAWDTTAYNRRRLSLDKTGASGPTAVTVSGAATADWDVPLGVWVSEPLSAQTISGTLDGMLSYKESSTSMDAAIHVHCYVTAGPSNSVRGTLLSNYVETLANELSTGDFSGRPFASTQTLTSVTAVDGDRLVIEFGYHSYAANSSAYNALLYYAGSPAQGDQTSGGYIVGAAPWIQFSADIAFSSTVWTQTRLYTSDLTAPYTPTTFKAAWDESARALTKALPTQKIDLGTRALVNANMSKLVTTANWDTAMYRGVSAALQAQTISGIMDVVATVWSGNNNLYHVHAYITQGDTDAVRGTLVTDLLDIGGVFWRSDFTTVGIRGIPVNAVTAVLGDRIVIEIGSFNAPAATDGQSIYYGGGSALLDAAIGPVGVSRDLGWVGLTTAPALLFVVQDARVSQVLLEGALQQTTAQDARVSQVAMEGALTQTAVQDARVSQVALDVAVAAYDPTPVAAAKRSQVIVVG